MNILKDALRRRLEEDDHDDHDDHDDDDHDDEDEDHSDDDHDEEEDHDDHDEHDGHAEVERWDAWMGWWEPFLWTAVDTIVIKAPGEIFENWLRWTMAYLTGHEFMEGGH